MPGDDCSSSGQSYRRISGHVQLAALASVDGQIRTPQSGSILKIPQSLFTSIPPERWNLTQMIIVQPLLGHRTQTEWPCSCGTGSSYLRCHLERTKMTDATTIPLLRVPKLSLSSSATGRRTSGNKTKQKDTQ